MKKKVHRHFVIQWLFSILLSVLVHNFKINKAETFRVKKINKNNVHSVTKYLLWKFTLSENKLKVICRKKYIATKTNEKEPSYIIIYYLCLNSFHLQWWILQTFYDFYESSLWLIINRILNNVISTLLFYWFCSRILNHHICLIIFDLQWNLEIYKEFY